MFWETQFRKKKKKIGGGGERRFLVSVRKRGPLPLPHFGNALYHKLLKNETFVCVLKREKYESVSRASYIFSHKIDFAPISFRITCSLSASRGKKKESKHTKKKNTKKRTFGNLSLNLKLSFCFELGKSKTKTQQLKLKSPKITQHRSVQSNVKPKKGKCT